MVQARETDNSLSEVVGVGLLGCGNVGAALVRLLTESADDILRRTHMTLEPRRIAVKNYKKRRNVPVDTSVFTTDAMSVIEDPSVHVVVELMGGMHPAKELITRALELGKSVVTANKELIANAGVGLANKAEQSGVDLLYEAAVGGGVPLVRVLRQSLAGEPIKRAIGIVNGTTNYILTRMTEDQMSYDAALKRAQELGYAEADPTADVEGFDAAAKAAIIAGVAFGAKAEIADVYREGISSITPADIKGATRLGYVIKPLVFVERDLETVDGATPRVGVRVHPTMIPHEHPLANVRLSFNALFVDGEASGELMFYGRGAGGKPTASAVLGDLIDAAHHAVAGGVGRRPSVGQAELWPIHDQRSAFALNLDVADKAGVLATVAQVFGKHDVSIRLVEQGVSEKSATLVFITHRAAEHNVREVLRELEQLPIVYRVGKAMHVLEEFS